MIIDGKVLIMPNDLSQVNSLYLGLGVTKISFFGLKILVYLGCARFC